MTEETREAILDAAEEAFVLEPPARVAVTTVADAAHVSVGTIYHHVGDKDGLRVAVAARILDRVLRSVRSVANGPGTPSERLIMAAATYVRFFAERPVTFTLAQITEQELRDSEPARRMARGVSARGAALVRELAAIVEEGQRAGEIRSGDSAAVVLELSAAAVGLCTLAVWQASAVRRGTGPAGAGSFVEAQLRRALAPEPAPELAPA